MPIRAKLGLAAWVYRYTDPAKARELLEEVIAGPAETTASNRTPPALTAAQLLEDLSAASPVDPDVEAYR